MPGEYPGPRRNGHKRRRRLALCAGRFLCRRPFINECGARDEDICAGSDDQVDGT
ncbi:hypothetical protein [Porcincola intestinalis]|uniref:hypothetical protein n=1 Tax=Porcincola intestinalis TaxID=2606632 RepID=UPI002A7FA454|nr:hypothetical protein [Porcincola intestinalis]MDY4203908.1 hypothetical protein [Porcincola intestinalis]